MFSHISNISSIDNFKIGALDIFKKGDSLFKIEGVNEELLISQVFDYYLVGDKLVYQVENLKDIYVIDFIKGSTDKIVGEFSLSTAVFCDQKHCYLIGLNDGNKELVQIDILELMVNSRIDYVFPQMLSCSFPGVFFKKRNELFKIDGSNGEIYWRYSVPADEKIIDLHQSNELLIIQSNNNKLFGLDMNTGLKLWELTDVSYYHTLDPNSGLLYSYAWDILRIINPSNGKIELEKQFEGSMEEYGIRTDANMHSISGGYLYFMSNWNTPRFGGINLNTLEIEFVQDLEVEEGVKGGVPHFHKDRLYIRDTINTLHIFERE